MFGDLHLGEDVRIFGQFKSGLENYRVGGPRFFDEDVADIGQLFLDVSRRAGEGGKVTIRTGRQEMAYGGLRLVDTRDGTNVHLAFDGVRTIYECGDRRLDAFLTKPVETNPGAFDDRPDPNQTFWGFYGVRPVAALPGGHLDYYYLGLRRNNAQFVQGIARETRHTLGTRWWGNSGPWDYNAEFVYQFGLFGEVPISAGAATADAGYTWATLPGSPRFGVTTVAASGGRGVGAKVLESYNPLFPTGAYFNRVPDLLGPTNILAVHPKLTILPTPKVRLIADWAFFGRTSLDDGIYGLVANLIRPAGGNRSRYIGNALSGEVQWQVNPHLAVVGAYTHIFPGPFLLKTGPRDEEDFVTVFIDYRF